MTRVVTFAAAVTLLRNSDAICLDNLDGYYELLWGSISFCDLRATIIFIRRLDGMIVSILQCRHRVFF